MLSVMLAVSLAGATVPASPAPHDPFARAGGVFRFSFERSRVERGKNEDLDFDGQPDDWTRRKGPMFPTYVESRIDDKISRHGNSSLRFDLNGGRAVYYSPPKRIDSLHAYVFEGWIRTQGLKNDAALLSLSFLNHKRQRVQRFLSRPVTGTHRDWVRVRIGPVFPKDDVWFVVVGCHAVPSGARMDLSGRIWFDNLWLGRLPHLALVDDYQSHFKKPSTPIQVAVRIGGLDREAKYRLELELFDLNGRVIERKSRELLAPNSVAVDSVGEARLRKPPAEVWSIPPQQRGFYRVQAALRRNGETIIEKTTTFIVMDPVEPRREGEFGWSITHDAGGMPLKDLAEVAAQSGIHWLKFPLWKTVAENRPNSPAEIIEMGDTLTHRRISLVGVLSAPPESVRRTFAADWTGVSEIFTLPPKFWWPSVEPVIARYSSLVRHWQVGSDGDRSFTGQKTLPVTVRTLKREFDQIGRDTRIIIPWNWQAPTAAKVGGAARTSAAMTAPPDRLPHTLFSIAADNRLSARDLEVLLQSAKTRGTPRWVLIRPLSSAKHSAGERGRDLVKQLVAAKAGGADAIFAENVFDSDRGLLTSTGAPTLLFLPWRTTALALQDSEFIGSLKLANGSRNFAFVRDGEGVLVLWRDEPGTEEVYLGPNLNVVATDIWGRQLPVPMNAAGKRQVLSVGPEPVIVRGCTEGILRMRLSLSFQVQQFQSRRGGQTQAVLGKNTFGQGIAGRIKLNLPRGWTLTPDTWQVRLAAGEAFKLPTVITVPPNASLGEVPVSVEFFVTADRPYTFRIHRTFRIGMGDVAMQVFDRKLPDGRLEIQQVITNNTNPAEVLSFRTSLFVPGYRRQRRLVVKLVRGKDKKFYFLPDAEQLRGKTLWLRAEQIDGNRVLNFQWKALENEQADLKAKKNAAKR